MKLKKSLPGCEALPEGRTPAPFERGASLFPALFSFNLTNWLMEEERKECFYKDYTDIYHDVVFFS
jgi:hypothetical protein